jgi:hypothetical protein
MNLMSTSSKRTDVSSRGLKNFSAPLIPLNFSGPLEYV